MHRVMVHQANYDNCRVAVDRAFDLFPLEITGKKVLVKPNALRASNPEQGIVTHHAVIRAIIEKLEESSPAEIIVGDNPGMMSYGANEKTFQQTGLMEAAKGHYRNIGSEAVEVDFAPKFLDRISVSRAVLEADVVISVPKFKTHGLTIITGAIKNSYGIIPGALKAKLHQKTGEAVRFSEMLVEVFRLKVPDLCIVDAVLGMEGNGPASNDLRQIGQIMASDNAVALDATMARMMGLDPQGLPFLEMARQTGLGDYNADSIEIVGDLPILSNFKLPPKARTVPTGAGEFFASRIRLRPRADKELCTGCETCVEQCPVSALSMVNDFPEVDPELCIACFCCQEMCPEMAIQLR
ncbi:MAG: DUF362 domain-containing protein [Deltaproteobacteria bacterium]|nr:DUF362 domain-containing protein [Deltaproteobacteria bacterium]MBW2053105.1 DUF362 domain-containing protein [Deltaproteobacteria bacterium]MBW2141986.1 DUF362 domain-containing protein [Deltaproteobacteria bacterium]MBW2323976.1 DUF362 domain-containing protein [Deltaproteobacteria bacterium]